MVSRSSASSLVVAVLAFGAAWCRCHAGSARAGAQLSAFDLRRAGTRIPNLAYRGKDFAGMSKVLNGHLRRMPGLSTAPCKNFSAHDLQEGLLARFFPLAEPELLALYALREDRRQRALPHWSTLEEARATWTATNDLVSGQPELQDMHRDGLCHETVMWFVHHLSERKRQGLLPTVTLPLLPERRHVPPATYMDGNHAAVHAEYESRVSCQQCHAGPISPSWSNATLPPPLPVDVKHPGRERMRVCDYQNQPPCGPCEGLGGPRWGDGVEDFAPVNCTVLATPTEIPKGNRPRPSFPKQGWGLMNGESRQPLAVRPAPGKPGKYPAANGRLFLAWDDTTLRHRYDFDKLLLGQPATQIYLQTMAQAKAGNSSGVMVTIIGKEGHFPSICVCTAGIAGVMQVDAFVPHEALDPLDLPSEEGGAVYLGRVRLAPIDGGPESRRTVIADHYMKWAFHFLVDADAQSASYGLPLRLYGPYGTRMVYSNWSLGDPRTEMPSLFEIPKHCLKLSKNCKDFASKPEGVSLDDAMPASVLV